MARSLRVAGSPDGRLAWQLVIASVPLGFVGWQTADFVDTTLRTPLVIAAASAGFGVLLYFVDRNRRGGRAEREMRLSEAILIGCAQVLALIPGTSRSGITMTAALALGMSRKAAGRVSFLLAIPAIGMAASWQTIQFIAEPFAVDWGVLLMATVVSAVTAFAAIALFLKLIETIGMAWFAAYRILLAVVIAYVFLKPA
jgi:undecaprenyl-diphosphatase